MKEIRIVLNNNEDTCMDKQFSIYIDDNEIKDVDKFTLVAKSFSREELKEDTFFDFDNVIRYTIESHAPYWEEPENEKSRDERKRNYEIYKEAISHY